MIIISEKKKINKVFYVVSYKEEFTASKVLFQETINCNTVVHEKDGFDYLLIYSPKMKLYKDAFEFLNIYNRKSPINSRMSSMTALKFLFSFQEIIKKSIFEFTQGDITLFKSLLKGDNISGVEATLELITTRSNNTIDNYISVYRQYIDFVSPDSLISSIFNKTEYTFNRNEENEDIRKPKYKISENKLKRREIPRYISETEFMSIHKYCRDRNLIMEECMIRLMYQCALRIGEVLGLTNEDLVNQKHKGNYEKAVIIRNRLTDKIYQNAKTCLTVYSKNGYSSSEYNEYNDGWQMALVPEDLYELIESYIEEYHSKAYENKHNNYLQYSVADQVDPSYHNEIGNFYIFINSQARPLSQKIWNERLRVIFRACDIDIDEYKRKHNLSHRFRHGFAMHTIKYRGDKVNRMQLAELMRHFNVSSVDIYYRPTISDKIKLKTDFNDYLYEIIPELRFKNDVQKLF